MTLDLALVRAEMDDDTTPIEFRFTDDIKEGERVFVLGYPHFSPNYSNAITFGGRKSYFLKGLGYIVTRGIVSKLIKLKGTLACIGTTADIVGGNSGGPLIDLYVDLE